MVRWFGYSGGSDEGPAAIFSVTWHQRLSMLPCRAMRYWIIGTALLGAAILATIWNARPGSHGGEGGK